MPILKFVKAPAEAGMPFACTKEDPELFFPHKDNNLQIVEAKTVCKSLCSVTEQCLETALRNGEEYGIWGATTEDERRTMKRRIARMGSRAI